MSKILKGIKISEADRSEAVANWGLNRNPSVAGPKEYAIRVRNGGRFIGDRYKDEKQAHRVLADLQKNYADVLHVVEVPSKMNEGGNVFKGKTAPIKIEDIDPTLLAYFAELKTIFPKKAAIFDEEHFHPLGSVRKKALSGDIDLGISVAYILDKKIDVIVLIYYMQVNF